MKRDFISAGTGFLLGAAFLLLWAGVKSAWIFWTVILIASAVGVLFRLAFRQKIEVCILIASVPCNVVYILLLTEKFQYNIDIAMHSVGIVSLCITVAYIILLRNKHILMQQWINSRRRRPRRP